MYFYDTCALLNMQDDAFKEHFIISGVTLKELESIKTSANKDVAVKAKARNMTRLLFANRDMYEATSTDSTDDTPNDIKIIQDACWHKDSIFVTDDLSCYNIAKNLARLNVCTTADLKNTEEYTGYKEIVLSDEALAKVYEHPDHSPTPLLQNEYLIIKNSGGEIVDLMKWDGSKLVKATSSKVKSNELGTISPLHNDIYQKMLLDSFNSHRITMARGAAGTGKTYLALGYLFSLLDKRKIDKIIVFCNTVPTMNSAKIGFLPGTRDEKLLESSVGNMLSAKLGDKFRVEQLINERKLELLPLCDVRGYDTTNMNAGILISEAQNMDISLMKLVLQRIGEDSICIIDGDYNAQVDDASFAGTNNGMKRTSEVFRGTEVYGEVTLRNIYRSRIAQIAEEM